MKNTFITDISYVERFCTTHYQVGAILLYNTATSVVFDSVFYITECMGFMFVISLVVYNWIRY